MKKTLAFILALLFLPCLPASGDGVLSCGSSYALGVRADGTVVSGGDSNSGIIYVYDVSGRRLATD